MRYTCFLTFPLTKAINSVVGVIVDFFMPGILSRGTLEISHRTDFLDWQNVQMNKDTVKEFDVKIKAETLTAERGPQIKDVALSGPIG